MRRARQPKPSDIAASIAIIDEQTATRSQQRTSALAAIEATQHAGQAASAEREKWRLPALAENDPAAKAKYDEASRTYLRLADDLSEQAALLEQLEADLRRLQRDRDEAVRAEALAKRAEGKERNADRHTRLEQIITEQVGPLVREMLDEYADMSALLAAAGFPSETVNRVVHDHQNLAFQIREWLFQAGKSHRLFVRALDRPTRTDRFRISPDDDMTAESPAIITH